MWKNKLLTVFNETVNVCFFFLSYSRRRIPKQKKSFVVVLFAVFFLVWNDVFGYLSCINLFLHTANGNNVLVFYVFLLNLLVLLSHFIKVYFHFKIQSIAFAQ